MQHQPHHFKCSYCGKKVFRRYFEGIAYICDDYTKYDWDKSIPNKEYFDEIMRISKNQIIFGGNYMTEYLPPSSCWIVWDKITGNNDYADCELAWTSFPKAVRQFRFMWKGMFQENMNWKEKRFHPTQKPVALGRWILQKFANKGDKVFDPFAGSGSFLIACKQLGYDYVGCEINQEYIEIANKRLQQTILNDDGGTNFTKSSADDFPTESLITAKSDKSSAEDLPSSVPDELLLTQKGLS